MDDAEQAYSTQAKFLRLVVLPLVTVSLVIDAMTPDDQCAAGTTACTL